MIKYAVGIEKIQLVSRGEPGTITLLGMAAGIVVLRASDESDLLRWLIEKRYFAASFGGLVTRLLFRLPVSSPTRILHFACLVESCLDTQAHDLCHDFVQRQSWTKDTVVHFPWLT